MKTIKSILAVSVLGISTVLFAGDPSAFFDVIPLESMDKAAAQVVVPNNLTASIYLSNPEGEIIYRNTTTKNSTSTKIYNFSNLENGIYTFNLVSEQANVVKKIMVEDSFIEVISKDIEYKPTFIVKDDKLLVNYLNLDQEEIQMLIYNSYRNLYSNMEGNSNVFQKKFDVSGLDTGEYLAMIKVGDKKYFHSFNID